MTGPAPAALASARRPLSRPVPTAAANLAHNLRKVLGKQISAQFQLPAHDLGPRDHADLAPRVVPVE